MASENGCPARSRWFEAAQLISVPVGSRSCRRSVQAPSVTLQCAALISALPPSMVSSMAPSSPRALRVPWKPPLSVMRSKTSSMRSGRKGKACSIRST